MAGPPDPSTSGMSLIEKVAIISILYFIITIIAGDIIGLPISTWFKMVALCVSVSLAVWLRMPV